MTYRITIADDKAQAFIAFLKEVPFITIAGEETYPQKTRSPLEPGTPLPGFGQFPDWEAPSRKEADAKRLGRW